MKIENNTYLNTLEQDSWNDIQAYHIENESAWRMVAIIAIIALLCVSVYAMYLVNQDKHKTLIFAKDDLGNITTLGLAYKTFNVDNKMVAHQLVNFIIALREVPSDIGLKRRNIDIVHSMIVPSLRTTVDNMFINEYSRASNIPTMISITEVKPLAGGHSWEISWQEDAGDADSKAVNITHWSSIITFTRQDDISPAMQIINPIGLFITYLHPMQDISDDDKNL